MPQIAIGTTGVSLKVSATETYDWAHRPGAIWPVSQLSGHRFAALFDANGLLDLTVDGRSDTGDVPADEFNAITSDFLRDRLPVDHPAYPVTVGQFKTGR